MGSGYHIITLRGAKIYPQPSANDRNNYFIIK